MTCPNIRPEDRASRAYRQGRLDYAIAAAAWDRKILSLQPSVYQAERWKQFWNEYYKGWQDERQCWEGERRV